MSFLGNNLAPTETGVDVATSPMISPQMISPMKEKTLHFAAYCSPNQFMPPPLEGFAYAVIGDHLYIFGGSDLNGQETADLYAFTLKSGWQKVESQNKDAGNPSPRVATAMTAYKKKLYVFGGINESQGWMNDFYEFDTETSSWKRLVNDDLSKGPTPRDKVALIAKRDKIYLYGGFGPRQQAATKDGGAANGEQVSATNSTPDLPSDANGVKTDETNGHKTNEANGDNKSTEADEEKDSEAAMNAARSQQVAAEFDYFDDFYGFDPSTGQWSPVEVDYTSSPTAEGDAKVATPPGLAAYTVCALADKLLYFGGKNSNGDRTNMVYCFALGLKKWIPLHVRDVSRWPVGRSFHASAVISDRYLITFGGRDVDDWERDDLWLLDINQMQWMLARCDGVGGVSAPCARYGHALAVLPDADSRLHVVIYGGSAELDPASGVAQDVLTDMYVVPADEIVQACAPVFGNVGEDKESKHNHHSFHFHKGAGIEEDESNGDEPTAPKVPRCDDCIDL